MKAIFIGLLTGFFGTILYLVWQIASFEHAIILWGSLVLVHIINIEEITK